MPQNLKVKICGLTREKDIDAAIEGGADYLGFIFFPPSKRSVDAQRWSELADYVDGRVPKVGVFVNADEEWLSEVHYAARLDWVQLHGKETPKRADQIRNILGDVGIIKALAVSEEADLDRASAYSDVADMLLFDAKPPKVPGSIPGGNGLSFDWRLLANRQFDLPWLLSGGISSANLRTATELTGAPGVDLSSSIEDAPGIKNIDELKTLLELAQKLGMS